MGISITEFNSLLESWASQSPPINYFTVENVMDSFGLGEAFYDHILSLLMSRNGFEINAEKMALCPSNHKLKAFALDEEVEEYFECYCQNDEFEINKFKLVFSFDEQFIMDSKKKSTVAEKYLKDLILI